MRESLTIRAYEPAVRSHSHPFHQVVVPLRGAIEMCLGDFESVIAVGQCVIVRQGQEHSFKAKKQARFLVADLHALPASANSLDCPFAAVSSAFKSFCLFADTQLSAHWEASLEDAMIVLFKELLAQQDFLPGIDRRIARALEHIEADLGQPHGLERLAAISALSVSRFKVLFAAHTGMSLGRYLLMLRMEKARALLANTDMPVNLVAEQTGYTDQSAFTRRFKKYHGVSPGNYRKR